MAEPLRSGTDRSKPVLRATEVLRAPPAKAGFETNFEQLAACLSAQTGGGLSPELSTDLALEIVLNEVVEQACLTTGATGAAIALEREGEMICRGCSGMTAPRLGSRLDITSGLTAECVRTRRTVSTGDAWADPRAEQNALRDLGIRSQMIMPLIRSDKLVGLLEILSSIPQAFNEREERTLEALAFRVFENLERASHPLAGQATEPLPEPPFLTFPAEKQSVAPSSSQAPLNEPASDEPTLAPGASHELAEPPRDVTPNATGAEAPLPAGFDVVTWSLRAAVIVCLIVLGLLLGRHLIAPNPAVQTHRVAAQPDPVSPLPTAAIEKPDAPRATQSKEPAKLESIQTAPASTHPAAPATGRPKEPPPGSLQVFENGKEIFRMPPSQATESQSGSSVAPVQRASSTERETASASSVAAAGNVVYRVEPEYPEEALKRKIQGPVVLDVDIGADGTVQNVNSNSGPPELAQAAIDAVAQWRFRPSVISGHAVPMRTSITLNFKLPQ